MTDITIKDIAEQEASKLQVTNNSAIAQAMAITVQDDNDYQSAAEFLKTVKGGIKTVEATFADMKLQAHKAHKAVCEKENSFKKPLIEAETIVKKKMQTYYIEQERIRREEEARIREEQRKLAEEQLAKAAALEAEGKAEQANAALQTASVIETLNTQVEVTKPKADGVSTQADYEIIITDEKQVPAYIMGATIRPVDLAAIKRLVKATGGAIEIPGVKAIETKSIRIRA